MPNLAIVGAQWGDEGKGKIIDVLAASADVCARYQGGNNAGHTVVVGDDSFVLHILPSGVLHEGIVNVIGNGVVIDPTVLFEEIDGLAARGVRVSASSLRVSERAHLIFPHHRTVDRAHESLLGRRKIGTTGRGIGPCYVDKVGRNGIRVIDLFDEATFRERLEAIIAGQNQVLTRIYGAPPLDTEDTARSYLAFARRLEPFVDDTSILLDRVTREDKRVLFEGAQGTFLDVDHGTYPYVTSSNASTAGIPAGTGLAANRLGKVMGVCKAYLTRVGEGPFPTEIQGDLGETLRQAGGEYGATTGRPRRCGWLDLVMARQAVRINGITGIALTKLDVLTGLEEVRVATRYELGGVRWDRVPARLDQLHQAVPVYESFPGWDEPLEGATSIESLPAQARTYVESLQDWLGVPVCILSTGRRRSELIVREDPWNH